MGRWIFPGRTTADTRGHRRASRTSRRAPKLFGLILGRLRLFGAPVVPLLLHNLVEGPKLSNAQFGYPKAQHIVATPSGCSLNHGSFSVVTVPAAPGM